jgi:membrane protein implicated in regulation of membrane protease activity
MMRRRPYRRDDATPRLLLAFLAATLAMVLAIAELRRSGSDWVDFVAIALLLVLAALVLTMLRRELDEEPPYGEDDAGERPAGR